MGKIKRFIQSTPIAVALMLYMIIFIAIAVLGNYVTIRSLNRYQINVMKETIGEYGDYIFLDMKDNYSTYVFFKIYGRERPGVEAIPWLLEDEEIVKEYTSSEEIQAIKEIMRLKNISPYIWYVVCTIIAALLFYNMKLKKPLKELNYASKKIAENELAFKIKSSGADELGRLCTSFEKMREALYENNLNMWETVEERKKLNAAFAHDLRTPLTVLKGYIEVLEEYILEGDISVKETKDMLHIMSAQVYRLENYTKTMKEIQKLEEIVVSATEIKTTELVERLKVTSKILCQRAGKELGFESNLKLESCNLDMYLWMQVYENIFSNAIRYAKENIYVSICETEEALIISVEDDGKGFTEEELNLACEPYYRSEHAENEFHFGLGLYICKVLCEKQGGNLSIENKKKDAKVTGAVISIEIFM